MSEKLQETQPSQLTLFAAGFPAKTYRWLESALDWLENGQAYGLSFIELLKNFNRDGLLSKMYPDYCPVTKGETWEYCSEGWPNSAMGGPTGCLMLNTSEWPKDAAVCSLSEVLEADVPHKYYLSPKAASGILRRAEKRGKDLPTMLLQALQQVAGEPAEPESQGDKIP